MRKIVLLLGGWLMLFSATAQSIDWAVGINKWYLKPKGATYLLTHFQPIYAFRPHEKIASIGAGQGIRDVVFSLMADSLTMYLQDVDPYWIAPERLSKTIQAVYRQAGRATCTTTFVPVRGKADETRLPEGFFDKIIVENSLHEFDLPEAMLRSIQKNLKPTGQLFVWEAVTTRSGRKHPDCGKPMFTDTSLIELLTRNGFRFIQKTVADPARGTDAVFQFGPVVSP